MRLSGRRVVVTGRVPGFRRAEVVRLLTSVIGAYVEDSVDSTTDVVYVKGLDEGTPIDSVKRRTAERYGVRMLDTERLRDILIAAQAGSAPSITSPGLPAAPPAPTLTPAPPKAPVSELFGRSAERKAYF